MGSAGALVQYQEAQPGTYNYSMQAITAQQQYITAQSYHKTKFKSGDIVVCVGNHPEYSKKLTKGQQYIIKSFHTQDNGVFPVVNGIHYDDDYFVFANAINPTNAINPKEENMVTEVVQDAKKFIKDHKTIVYWIALFLIADHFLFNGAFKERLKNMMNSLIGKVESKINDTKA